MAMTTALVASDDSLLLGPMEEGTASRILGDLLMAWQTGMRQPLPIAVKTAFSWLGQTDPMKAQAAARKAYEGDGLTTDGERRESPALSRQFADYDALIADETFPDWCDALYRPLLEASWRSLTSEEARS
jgi:exodeoxyribonuclease V gamma subunit